MESNVTLDHFFVYEPPITSYIHTTHTLATEIDHLISHSFEEVNILLHLTAFCAYEPPLTSYIHTTHT